MPVDLAPEQRALLDRLIEQVGWAGVAALRDLPIEDIVEERRNAVIRILFRQHRGAPSTRAKAIVADLTRPAEQIMSRQRRDFTVQLAALCGGKPPSWSTVARICENVTT